MQFWNWELSNVVDLAIKPQQLCWCPSEAVVCCLITKLTKWHVRPAKTLISLGIRPVWSESLLSAWRNIGPLTTYWAHSEDWSDLADVQADLSLRWAHVILLVLSCGGSYFLNKKKKQNQLIIMPCNGTMSSEREYCHWLISWTSWLVCPAVMAWA